MRALTLWRPWPWAICQLGKRVENRNGKPFSFRLLDAVEPGEYRLKQPVPIALHAGQKLDKAALVHLRMKYTARQFLHGRDDWVGVVAVAMAVGMLYEPHLRNDSPKRSEHGDWLVPGGYGIELADVVELAKPLAIPGAQGWWNLTGEQVEQLQDQLRKQGVAWIYSGSAGRV